MSKKDTEPLSSSSDNYPKPPKNENDQDVKASGPADEQLQDDSFFGSITDVPDADKHYHKQCAVWVFIEKLHTETVSEFPWDKRGEFFVVVNGCRFPNKGKIYMHKNELWMSPKPRSIYCEYMKEKNAKCELTIEVMESDPLFNDKLMKFKLIQPFLPGTYRKVINLVNSPIVLSLIIKLEKNLYTIKHNLVSPMTPSKKKSLMDLKDRIREE